MKKTSESEISPDEPFVELSANTDLLKFQKNSFMFATCCAHILAQSNEYSKYYNKLLENNIKKDDKGNIIIEDDNVNRMLRTINTLKSKIDSFDASTKSRLLSVIGFVKDNNQALMFLSNIKFDGRNNGPPRAVNIEGALERTISDPYFDINDKANVYNREWTKALNFMNNKSCDFFQK